MSDWKGWLQEALEPTENEKRECWKTWKDRPSLARDLLGCSQAWLHTHKREGCRTLRRPRVRRLEKAWADKPSEDWIKQSQIREVQSTGAKRSKRASDTSDAGAGPGARRTASVIVTQPSLLTTHSWPTASFSHAAGHERIEIP